MTKNSRTIKFRIVPLTPNLWPALEDLFGKWGASNGCWCMYWRIGGAYRGRCGENRETLRKIVKRGSSPGLLAFDGDLAVGWCQLTPRDALPWLDRMRWFQRVDDVPVWSISCFFVRRAYRRQGGDVPAYRCGFEDCKTREGTCARGLPGRYDRAEEHLEHLHRNGLCVRRRGLQGGRSPRRGSPDHAPRSKANAR
jgi:hypothetical protein